MKENPCKYGHQWNGCRCERCGQFRDEGHHFRSVKGQCIEHCADCGKVRRIPHTFENGICKVCGQPDEGDAPFGMEKFSVRDMKIAGLLLALDKREIKKETGKEAYEQALRLVHDKEKKGKCRSGHKWHGCMCERCGKTRYEGHEFKLAPDACEEICIICGKRRPLEHRWNGCTCTHCGAEREEGHDFRLAPDACEEVCSICGKSRPVEHRWNGCTCTHCGERREEGHDFRPVPGKCEEICSICGESRPLEHRWNGCTCTRCGAKREKGHDFKPVPGKCEEICSICGEIRETGKINEVPQNTFRFRISSVFPVSDNIIAAGDMETGELHEGDTVCVCGKDGKLRTGTAKILVINDEKLRQIRSVKAELNAHAVITLNCGGNDVHIESSDILCDAVPEDLPQDPDAETHQSAAETDPPAPVTEETAAADGPSCLPEKIPAENEEDEVRFRFEVEAVFRALGTVLTAGKVLSGELHPGDRVSVRDRNGRLRFEQAEVISVNGTDLLQIDAVSAETADRAVLSLDPVPGEEGISVSDIITVPAGLREVPVTGDETEKPAADPAPEVRTGISV